MIGSSQNFLRFLRKPQRSFRKSIFYNVFIFLSEILLMHLNKFDLFSDHIKNLIQIIAGKPAKTREAVTSYL